MKKRIQSLLNDARMDGLSVTPEFATARYSLALMQKCLEDGKDLSLEQIKFLQRLEIHIRNIHPHFENLTVNGEDIPVLFITDPILQLEKKP